MNLLTVPLTLQVTGIYKLADMMTTMPGGQGCILPRMENHMGKALKVKRTVGCAVVYTV